MTRKRLFWIYVVALIVVMTIASCSGEPLPEDGDAAGGSTISVTLVGKIEGASIYRFTNQGDICYVIDSPGSSGGPSISCHR